MLRSPLKYAVKFVYTPLYAIAISIWMTDTIFYEEQWICTKSRIDTRPEIKQQFLYFTVWNMWMAAITFAAWAYPRPCSAEKSSSVAPRVFRVALPLCSTVMVTYVYYVVATAGILSNTEDSYCKLRSCMAKSMGDESVANVYLAFHITTDFVVHWLSAPLLWLLLLSGELEYQVLFPYSTVFILVLGVVIGLLETYTPSKIYSGTTWFNVSMCILFNFVFHCMFVVRDRRIKKLKKRHDSLKVDNQVSESTADAENSSGSGD